MVSSSKILTVSYGTFSCTAEGFEDPLAAVKDATRFYQGIVREDRFFGSEPPQLDAEMAEQMMAQQIGAEYGDHGLVLRPALGAPAAASSSAMAAALAAGPSRAASAAPQAVVPDAMENAAEADTDDSGVLASVGSAVAAETTAQPVVQPEPEHEDVLSDAYDDEDPESALIDEAEVEIAETADFSETSFDEMDLIEEEPAAPTHAEMDEVEAEEEEPLPLVAETQAIQETAVATSAETAQASPAPAPAGSAESVAAKLERIRAVVSGGVAAAAPAAVSPAAEVAYSEDEHADAGDDDYDADDMNGVLDAVSASTLVDDGGDLDTDELEAPETLGENLFTDTIASMLHDSVVADEADDAVAETFAADYDEDDTGYDDEDEEEAAAPAPPPLRRTRVVKVKRADFDAAVARGQLEAVEDDSASSLSAEEEEELARELAAVEAELDGDDWADEDDDWPEVAPAALLPEAAEDADMPTPLRLHDKDRALADLSAAQEEYEDDYEDDLDVETALDDDEDEDDEDDFDTGLIDRMAREGARKAVKLSSPARVMLTENRIEEDDGSVSRILDETNTQLEEPEGNRRRSAIAHLRAAVAATRADKLLGRKKDPEEQFEPYREDLANVVRPRRPQPAAEARTERPQSDVRPAPLKLVAEQRVDESSAGGPSTVRPRRIRRAEIDDTDIDMPEADDSGFAAFAEDMGATDLPELLEAAAAYMAFVEGRDQFSRPQLMTKVRQAELNESSREDRLRSFGQLLREGKIEKTRGGRFTASDSISYKPGARAAG